MTEEQKIEALQRILQGANVAQVNLGDGYQTFNLRNNDDALRKEDDAVHFDNEDSSLSESNVIFNTRILTTEEHYRKVRDVILRFIKQEGVASDVEQINPSAQNEWYYIMKGIRESGMARSDMGDTKFAGQMVAWFPDMFADKIGEGDSKDFVRNFAKSISAERNNYWTKGAERKEVPIIDMYAHARTRNIDNGKAIRAFGIANGLKKALEELKTEIQKAQSAR